MIDWNSLQGPLVKSFFDSDLGSRLLWLMFLQPRFGSSGSEQRYLGSQYGNVFSDYLAQQLSGLPDLQGLGGFQAPGYSGSNRQPTSFVDFLGSYNPQTRLGMSSPQQRGESPGTFQPLVRRVR